MDTNLCKICYEKFDDLDRKPMVLMLCGHTICQKCLNSLPTKNCSECREKIISAKPNYALIESLNESSASNPSTSTTNKTTKSKQNENKSSSLLNHKNHNDEDEDEDEDEDSDDDDYNEDDYNDNDDDEDDDEDTNDESSENFYSSINHKHKFVELEPNNKWRCDGRSIYGKCKSNLDLCNSYKSHKRFNCTECFNFDLCYKCLKGEKVDYFQSLNHPHKFIKINKSSSGWSCDGKTVFGSCNSKSNNKSLVGKLRFKCVECKAFDFCPECLSLGKKNEFDKEFETPLHEHKFIKINMNKTNWKCKGNELYGVCRSSSKNNINRTVFKCTQCRKFTLCSECFKWPDNLLLSGSSLWNVFSF